MKKLTASLISVILLLMLASCKTIGNFGNTADFNSDQFLERYDHDRVWMHIIPISCRADNVICFTSPTLSNSPYIRYADLESGFSGPLCGKPECRHTDQTCNAYIFSNTAEGISYYDGRIYWAGSDLQGAHIFSSALDGTDRRTVRDLDRSVFTKPGSNRFIIFHRGYMYLCGGTFEVTDGITTYGCFLSSVPIDGNEAETVIWENNYSDPEIGVKWFMQGYRTSLYFMEMTWKGDAHTMTLCRWDAADQELETLFDGEVPFSPYEFWVEEDGVLFSSTLCGEIYKYEFESGEISLLFDFNSDGSAYEGCHFADDKLVSWVLDDDQNHVVRVTDFAGNIVFNETLDIPEYRESGWSTVFCGADQDNLYFQLSFMLEESNHVNEENEELVSVSLDTGEVRVLWSGKAET